MSGEHENKPGRHVVQTAKSFRDKFHQEVPKPKKKKHEKKRAAVKGKTWSQLTKAEKDDVLEVMAVQMGLVQPEDDSP